jgi:hypothetical protein
MATVIKSSARPFTFFIIYLNIHVQYVSLMYIVIAMSTFTLSTFVLLQNSRLFFQKYESMTVKVYITYTIHVYIYIYIYIYIYFCKNTQKSTIFLVRGWVVPHSLIYYIYFDARSPTRSQFSNCYCGAPQRQSYAISDR